MDNLEYLRPVFDRAEAYHALLPAPAAGSSLAADDRPLGGWNGSTLIRSSVGAGVAHVEALNRMVTKAGVVDPYTPWTLLRGALETFATAVWLLAGKDRIERRSRALALWAEDLRNRAQHEDDTHYVITGPGEKSGADRREEILQRGDSIGIPRTSLPAVKAGGILEAAATAAGLDPRAVRASWRVGSGFAHGRFWPLLRAGQPRAAHPTAGGFLVGFVLDDTQLARLADGCEGLLHFAGTSYQARSISH